MASTESGQKGLLWRSQERAATTGCPIDFEQAAEFEFLPPGRAQQGKEAGERVAPLAQPGREAQQHIGQQGRPHLPADSVGGVTQEVRQLEGLFDLFEEHLANNPVAIVLFKRLTSYYGRNHGKNCTALCARRIMSGSKARTMQSRRSNPGVLCIAGSLFALAFFWLPFLIERFYGSGHLSPALLVFGGACGFTALSGCIVALVFYVPLCWRVWRDSSRANWRLWAVGTVLLLAVVRSVLFYP